MHERTSELIIHVPVFIFFLCAKRLRRFLFKIHCSTKENKEKNKRKNLNYVCLRKNLKT